MSVDDDAFQSLRLNSLKMIDNKIAEIPENALRYNFLF